ncbi:phage antirepressor KilAC domain-containing protein [Acinetobacter higginsii]|uniref:phage antirepressor KilAC domain-containing protein n=1 Tax=Acinetobacter higginsii TaxID=70347 RepID=UPI001F4A9352|nr:phage antirepressor KilAC domain-containing protein [Acinetobacter higginsii]MCH7380659.1 phage antirepressor KilAC domain-containing protein [Acinetobacter higginsii]
MNNPILAENLSNANQKSMTHLDIAELVQSRPDSVKRSIERLADKGVIRLPPLVNVEKINNLGHVVAIETYIFKGEQGELDSITVVAQLCPEFTAALVKRWHELEHQVKQPQELSKLEVLQMAIESEKQKVALELQVSVLEPKALALDAIADTSNTYTIRECATTIKIKEKELVNLIIDKGWCYRDASNRLRPYAQKVQQGVFINRASPVITHPVTQEEKVYLHMHVTAYGLTRLTALVNRHRGG